MNRTTARAASAIVVATLSVSTPLLVTRGRYESLANGSRLLTLLPEMGAQIATLHRRQINQLLVTAYRRPGLKGQLQNAQIGLTRKNLKGSVSLDGLPR